MSEIPPRRSYAHLNLIFILLLFMQSAFSQHVADSLTITIKAEDLSEDNKLLATGNDEIIFQLYIDSENELLEAPIIYREMLFDEGRRSSTVTMPLERLDSTRSYLIYWTEYDYDKTYEQRTPVYRTYHKEINVAFQDRKWKELKKYLGTDDLLGFRKLGFQELTTKTELIFEGVQNLEKYKYIIRIE